MWTHYEGFITSYGLLGVFKQKNKWQNVAQRSCGAFEHLQATCSQIVHVMHGKCIIITYLHLLHVLEAMKSTKNGLMEGFLFLKCH
jgi:hypothetical protein